MTYRVSPDADRDLEEIFLYWGERAGEEVADRLIDSITERFWLLGEYPQAGPACNDIAPGVRCFPVGEYLIYYRKAGKYTDILHVFRSTQDQKKTFRKKKKR